MECSSGVVCRSGMLCGHYDLFSGALCCRSCMSLLALVVMLSNVHGAQPSLWHLFVCHAGLCCPMIMECNSVVVWSSGMLCSSFGGL